MVRKVTLKESTLVSNVPEFGVLYDEFTYSTGFYPDSTYKQKKLPSDSSFTNFFEFLNACTKVCNYKVPFNTENFTIIEFDKLTSKITLGWNDDDGIWHNLYAILYLKPSPLTYEDLDKFNIELK